MNLLKGLVRDCKLRLHKLDTFFEHVGKFLSYFVFIEEEGGEFGTEGTGSD